MIEMEIESPAPETAERMPVAASACELGDERECVWSVPWHEPLHARERCEVRP